jgi:hypothetical protein
MKEIMIIRCVTAPLGKHKHIGCDYRLVQDGYNDAYKFKRITPLPGENRAYGHIMLTPPQLIDDLRQGKTVEDGFHWKWVRINKGIEF